MCFNVGTASDEVVKREEIVPTSLAKSVHCVPLSSFHSESLLLWKKEPIVLEKNYRLATQMRNVLQLSLRN